MTKESVGSRWLSALRKEDLKVLSATDALQTQGFLNTGNFALNWAVSGRLGKGLPLGRTVEIFGDPSTGKSFLVARLVAACQAAGGVALLDDTEGSYDLRWIHNLGVDADALGFEGSRTVREHLQLVTGFVEAYKKMRLPEGTPGLVACDSLSLLSTEHELDTRLEKKDMSKAAELKAFFRIIGKDLASLPVTHVSTSHTIANVGNFFNPRTTSGGGGPKFQASVRIDLQHASKIKTGTEFTGVLVSAFIEKNRVTAPWKRARFAIPFYEAISPVSGLIPLLLELGILKTQGHFIEHRGVKTSIRAHLDKKAFLLQDQSAEALLDQVPELIEEADQELDRREETASWKDAEVRGEDDHPEGGDSEE